GGSGGRSSVASILRGHRRQATALSAAPPASTRMKHSLAATATVALTPVGIVPTTATNAASRTPMPPGTGTDTKPTIQERMAAGATASHRAPGSKARATHHVAVPISNQLGRYLATNPIEADHGGTSMDRSRLRSFSARPTSQPSGLGCSTATPAGSSSRTQNAATKWSPPRRSGNRAATASVPARYKAPSDSATLAYAAARGTPPR